MTALEAVAWAVRQAEYKVEDLEAKLAGWTSADWMAKRDYEVELKRARARVKLLAQVVARERARS